MVGLRPEILLRAYLLQPWRCKGQSKDESEQLRCKGLADSCEARRETFNSSLCKVRTHHVGEPPSASEASELTSSLSTHQAPLHLPALPPQRRPCSCAFALSLP